MLKKITKWTFSILVIAFIALIPGQFVVTYEADKIAEQIKSMLSATDRLCKSNCTDKIALNTFKMDIETITKEQLNYCINTCKNPRKLKEQIITAHLQQLHFENPYYEASMLVFCVAGLRCPYNQLYELINN